MAGMGRLKAFAVRKNRYVRRYYRARQVLRQIGWFDSFEALPVDGEGNPLPWITYPASFLLAERVPSEARVFEYGSGQSTRWWASRVAQVTSCEHDAEWAARIAADLPSNALLLHRPRGDSYINAVTDGGPYEVIVIDGRDRVACARSAMTALAPDGVIVWDNTDREYYAPGITSLVDAGFAHLPLKGLTPGSRYLVTTSIFYRPGNCLML